MLFTTAGAMNALFKKQEGKDVETVYVRVDDLGTSGATELAGKDLPLDQIQAIGKAKNAIG